MTRLVLHAGTHATGWAVMAAQLVSWRDGLQPLGVRLHPSDDPGTWAADLTELAEGTPPDSVVAAVRSAVRDDADILLLSSERLEDSVREPGQLAGLERFALDHEVGLDVLVVVRDQVGYLNELYCDRIMQLQMARDFPSFAADPQPEGRFDYNSAFDAVLGSADIAFTAIPYSSLPEGAEAGALLAASGLSPADLALLPISQGREPLPGPVLIAATRLLFKRMWRMGIFKHVPRPQLLDAVDELRATAAKQGWDDGPFWGWSERARRDAIARFRPGNTAFAQAAWGHGWLDSWEDGTFVDVDLAASPPALVVDVLLGVDKIVKAMQQAKAAATAGVSSE